LFLYCRHQLCICLFTAAGSSVFVYLLQLAALYLFTAAGILVFVYLLELRLCFCLFTAAGSPVFVYYCSWQLCICLFTAAGSFVFVYLLQQAALYLSIYCSWQLCMHLHWQHLKKVPKLAGSLVMHGPADREYLLRKLFLATAIYQPPVKLNLSRPDI
jgi:hypothetical protein